MEFVYEQGPHPATEIFRREHCSSNRFQREQIGYHSHLRIPRCRSSQARVYYMRVLSSLSESEIKNVLKIRNGDPILPNEPTLVDLMIS
jgi:hypothetical protein